MNRLFFIIFILFLVNIIAVQSFAVKTETGWKAGIAKVRITPGTGLWMAGYASRTGPATGKIHDLWAHALFLEDSTGNQALMITADLVGFPKKISDTIRSRIQKELGLERSEIILNSTHTHSGPVLREALSDIYPMDSLQPVRIETYSRMLEESIMELAKNARQKLKPASLHTGMGVVRFQVNRRNNRENQMDEITSLKGPNDFSVPVIRVSTGNGKPMAVVFGYACHPTVLNGLLWSGDYPGYARLELEKKYKGITAMFFQGAGGDLNPIPRRENPLAKQYGAELAAAVERVLSKDMTPLAPLISTGYTETLLLLNEPPDREWFAAWNKKSKGYLKAWGERMLDSLNQGKTLRKSYPYPVQIWKLGGQKIFSLGGELLSGYSILLKQLFGKEIFVMGYSNDVMAYIPTEKVLHEGGYEGETSQMAYGLPSTWKKGIETNILETTVLLARQMGVIHPDSAGINLELIKKLSGYETITHVIKPLIAERHFSGFDNAHDTYNAISAAADGKVYYVLSSQLIDKGGQMYLFDPEKGKPEWLADLTEICGESGMRAVAQGKSHVRFYESRGKLYFATHVGFYEMIDGMECLPVNPPGGYALYPGGHILSYDLSVRNFTRLAIAPEGEGILTMTMDTLRKRIYAITWPAGYFLHYDLEKDIMHNLGKVSASGEAGKVGEDYRVLCRSMVINPGNGKVFYSTAEGDIMEYDPDQLSRRKLTGVDLRLDYFGKYDFTRPGSMAYNWRAVVWHEGSRSVYGVHGNSGYLFRFNPQNESMEIIDRITSLPSRKSGMFDQFSYGYLGFDLGPDGETLYYLTGGPFYIDGKRVKGVDEIAMGAARGLENLHLVTWHIPTGKYTDHGPVTYSDGTVPTYVNSIAVGTDGFVYTLARFENNGKIIEDLIRFPDPLKNP